MNTYKHGNKCIGNEGKIGLAYIEKKRKYIPVICKKYRG